MKRHFHYSYSFELDSTWKLTNSGCLFIYILFNLYGCLFEAHTPGTEYSYKHQHNNSE